MAHAKEEQQASVVKTMRESIHGPDAEQTRVSLGSLQMSPVGAPSSVGRLVVEVRYCQDPCSSLEAA